MNFSFDKKYAEDSSNGYGRPYYSFRSLWNPPGGGEGGDFGGWVETQQFISTHWARANPQVWSTVLSRNISIFIMRLRDRSTKYIHAKRVKLVEDLWYKNKNLLHHISFYHRTKIPFYFEDCLGFKIELNILFNLQDWKLVRLFL